MLDELHVENLALIEEADFVPGPGLTVLTGETGAGKSALLSALKLLMGERADSAMVREGESAATVEGRLFEGSQDIEGVAVARRLSADGRSRVRIDGQIAGVKELSRRIRPLIDLCGQHEHQRLLDSASHIEMVDMWAGESVGKALARYRETFAAVKAARKDYDRIVADSKAQGARIDDARFALEQIDAVNPDPDEFNHLREVLPRAVHAELLASTAHESHEALSGESGALDAVNTVIAELSRLGDVDDALGDIARSLTDAAIQLEDASSALRAYRDELDFDPDELQLMQERFGFYKSLLRQFGPELEDVIRRREEASSLLAVVDHGEVHIKRAKKKLDAAESVLIGAARDLASVRASFGPRFCREVTKQMARLEMGHAELIWHSEDLAREAWTRNGSQSFELLYRSGEGLTPRPLKRIASGGELSRVMLACKVVLGESDGVDTLVFDEVDAGVGGSTARSLASVLSELSRSHQVIVVTHLAQVAVMGDKHYVVRKSDEKVPVTSIVEVTGKKRVDEVARMLSGDLSELSREHAEQLLREAGTL